MPSQSTSSSQSPSAGLPLPSPSVSERLQEKNALAGLNNRLAVYMERVRVLEAENSRLSRAVEQHEGAISGETTRVKGLYEGELKSTRKLLDDLAKENAKLQLENGTMKKDLEHLRAKYIHTLSVFVGCMLLFNPLTPTCGTVIAILEGASAT